MLLPAAKLSRDRIMGASICRVMLDCGWLATLRSNCREPVIKHSKLWGSKGTAPRLMQIHTQANVKRCLAMPKEACEILPDDFAP